MEEGHIEFTLSVCVPDLCPTHNFITHGGFKNHLAQMIKARRCVARKNHVTKSKVKITVCT